MHGRQCAERELRAVVRSDAATGPFAAPMKVAGARSHLHARRDRRLNYVDPQAWLADVLARLPDYLPSASTSSCLDCASSTAR